MRPILSSCPGERGTRKMAFRFYLGTHMPMWLELTDKPLFISYPRLLRLSRLPTAAGPWVMDCSGYTALTRWGRYPFSVEEYVINATRFYEEIGNLQWIAPLDYMCEPAALGKTGLTIHQHQLMTIGNYLRCRQLAPELPWTPVLQGWTSADYVRHIDMYRNVGVDLSTLPAVGVGSICRRQGTLQAERILECLHSFDLKLHAFGFKKNGLQRAVQYLVSADSMAWSFDARYTPILMDGCYTHQNCANCLKYALHWRESVLSLISGDSD